MSHPQQQPVPPAYPYAVEVTYTALGGKLQFTNIFLAFPSRKTSHAVADDEKISESDFTVRDESFLPGYAVGMYRQNAASTWVVITVATAKKGVSTTQLDNYLKHANTDFSAALNFRL